ncbi:MAG: hypothetical protein ACP5R5_09405 [Armatimonadota bacterium]
MRTSIKINSLPRPKRSRELRRFALYAASLSLTILFGLLWPIPATKAPPLSEPPRPVHKVLSWEQTGALFGNKSPKIAASRWHPPHMVKVWMARHKGRTFRVIQLPRCEHLETVITYDPSGETLARAKRRIGGVAALTGSYHHPQTMALADFLQRDGCVLAAARTGRCLVAIDQNGTLDISPEYSGIKGASGVSALALGQRLVPFVPDGFSTAFMNRVTDRMAIGVNKNFIFIVQGKSDIWRLAHFFRTKLPVRTAINSDGGHVVRGKAPVHIVFRWRKVASPQLGFLR